MNVYAFNKRVSGSQEGSILFLSLWVLVFLSLLALYAGLMTRQQIAVLQRVEQRSALYDIAEAGVMIAIEAVNSPQEKDINSRLNSLRDFWFDDRVLFKEMKVGEGIASVAYDYLDNIVSQKKKHYGVIDEDRKININSASEKVLTGLFSVIADLDTATASELARHVIDWRDKDDSRAGYTHEVSERLDYLHKRYAYFSKNQPFETVEEILLVMGMNVDVFAKIRDFITVYSEGRVNINTVSEPVLIALGLDYSLAKKIITVRSGVNRIEGDFDDISFSSLEEIIDLLDQQYELTEKELRNFSSVFIENILSIASNAFSVCSTSRLDNTQMYGRITCVFTKNGDIRYWNAQYARLPERESQ